MVQPLHLHDRYSILCGLSRRPFGPDRHRLRFDAKCTGEGFGYLSCLDRRICWQLALIDGAIGRDYHITPMY
jgi:hypothetical protein